MEEKVEMGRAGVVMIGVLVVGTLISFASTTSSVAAVDPFTTVVLSVIAQKKPITIRTENYPRPPYSGATYYIYEREGEVICTKLEVCNKFDECETTYKRGTFKDDVDVETGDPYGRTKPVVIAAAKERKHVCLTKFKLL
jgi:hypothetical protein